MSLKMPTAGVILAAGMSKRFQSPKQLVEINGKLMLEWVIDAAIKSKLEKNYLVLGHHADDIIKALMSRIPRTHHPDIVINPNYRDGLSQSLKCGLAAVAPDFPSVMFLLGDQPRVNSRLIDSLLECFWESEKDICVPTFQGIRGNPTVFSRSTYPLLNAVEGDIGAREIIRRYPHRVRPLEIDDPRCFLDLDTEADLDQFH